jgi:Mg-chelatase subunit ChlD
VAVIAFDSRASVVFEGRAGEADQLRATLEQFGSALGTDVAEAMRKANEYVRRLHEEAHPGP